MAEFENIFEEDARLDAVAEGKATITLGMLLQWAAFSMLTALAVVIGMLAYHYFSMRTWDLTGHTSELNQYFLETLRSNYIPDENVRLVKTEERRNDIGRWRHFSYEVMAPPHLDWDGWLSLVQERLAERKIAMKTVESDDATRRYELALERFVFGDIAFRFSAATISDASGASVCDEVLSLVRDALLQSGVSAGSLSVQAVRLENNIPISRFTIMLNREEEIASLHQAIQAALDGRDIWSTIEKTQEQRFMVVVGYQDTACVELVCVIAPGAPPLARSEGEEADGIDVPEGMQAEGDSEGDAAPPLSESSAAPEPESAAEKKLDELLSGLKETAGAPETVQTAPPSTVPSSESGESTEPSPSPSPPPRVAIILDDGGYGGADTTRVLALDANLTLAILPDTPFGQQTARDALAKGFEIMLHMPMQTNSTSRPFPGEIQTTMTREQIQTRARECLDQYPDALGVNNHTGAAFTADQERVRWFLEVVREYGKYFIDSRTTAQSYAYDVALELGIPAAMRNVFLDNSSDEKLISAQFAELMRVARERGKAIGIGHFRRNTITTLERELPRLKELGVMLVPVSEILK